MNASLFVRSVYSLLSSMCKIEDIISYGKKYKYNAIALVDKNVLAGAMSFKKQAEANNIKPIFGLEFDIELRQRQYSMVLYAKDDQGFKNLMALSSYICTNDDKVIDLSTLNKYRSNNILCMLSDDMPLTYVLDKKLDMQEAYQQLLDDFSSDFIVGLVDHNVVINAKRDLELKEFLKEKGIKYVPVNRTYFMNKDDHEDYEVLKCIKDKQTISNEYHSYDIGRHFMSYDELTTYYDKQDFVYVDELIGECNVTMNYQTSLPLYPCKAKVNSKDYLVGLCKEGLKRRLKGKISQEYINRLNYELKVILDMHFEDYFLIVYDFILFAKKNDIMVGPGRGSAAGSLVSYCLGITEIDSLKYGLIFERFLNPERISMPDIDTDFPDDRRDEVINYVKEKYGEDHVGHIITYGTLKAKQVIRDVGRVLKYTTNEIDSISKMIPFALNMTLDQAYKESPLFRQKIESDAKYRRLFAIARKLEGNPRHESTHAAGIVISRKPLSEVVPLIKIESDINSTQYTMEHLEQLGLIKMDFLGLRNLSIISEIVEEINKHEVFNINEIPLDDEKTFKLIDTVNVLGVFQLESSGMQNLIRKMKPNSFEEIGMCIALFRPGPMENIPQFLDNRSNPDKIEYLHPALKTILNETYGVIVYQEQIMNIARSMAGFTYGKADVLRKAMSKKKAAELEKLYPDFIDGCLNNGYSSQLAEKVYELILKFANYGFNKSHSIVYGLVAYQMAYLKANYPLYFYKSLLNGVIGSQAKTYDYILECQNTKQKVKGVNINSSDVFYQIISDEIVMPFTVCMDVGSISANKIIEEREQNGPYTDFVSCVCRLTNAGVERNVIENLIYVGALDGLGYGRHTMLEALNNVLKYAQAHKGDISIFNDIDAPLIENLNDDNMVLAENEKKVLGFYFAYNPINTLRKKNKIDCENLYDLSFSKGYVKGFGMINRIKQIKTKKGDPMAFVDLIDDKGELSLALMPDIYSSIGTKLEKGDYVCFEGNMEKQNSCLVKKIKLIQGEN